VPHAGIFNAAIYPIFENGLFRGVCQGIGKVFTAHCGY